MKGLFATLSIKTLSINDSEQNNNQYRLPYAECRKIFIVMLNVIMLSVVMLNVVAPLQRALHHGKRDKMEHKRKTVKRMLPPLSA
jgi:hypothetical protein